MGAFKGGIGDVRVYYTTTDPAATPTVTDIGPLKAIIRNQGTFGDLRWLDIHVQSTRQLLLAQDRLELPTVASITSSNIARRFRLANKGDIAPGFDADLWIADLAHVDVVRREDLLYRNPFSAHEGQKICGRTIETLVRGEKAGARGQLIRPGGDS